MHMTLKQKNTKTEDVQDAAKTTTPPSSVMKDLADLLVGTWKIAGDAQGETRYERVDGGHFLLQHVQLDYDGRRIEGLEVLGHLHPIDKSPTKEIWTRFYSHHDGLTLD